jgi:transposase-like protein
MAIEPLGQPPPFPIEFIADGNPSYDAAVHVINADADGKPLERRTVVGLENIDEESEQYRPFKQLIERLNRTYKFHTRARSGFKSQQGAVALTALFAAYYNFLRPHHTLYQRTPIHIAELHEPDTLQGQWLKLLQLAA